MSRRVARLTLFDHGVFINRYANRVGLQLNLVCKSDTIHETPIPLYSSHVECVGAWGTDRARHVPCRHEQ